MGSSGVTCEIVEVNDESNFIHSSDGSRVQSFKLTADDADGKYHCYPANDDLNQLMKNIDLRMSPRVVSSSRQIGADTARKSALKQPVKVGIYRTPGIGMSESVTLKQALRRLCISQASEIAAMKRSSKPSSVSSVPEMGAIKKLHASLVVQHSDSSFPLDERIDNLVKISVVPPKNAISSSEKANELLKSQNSESSNKFVVFTPQCTVSTKAGATKTSIQDMIRNESSDSEECSSTSRRVGKKDRAISKTGSGIAAESGKSNTSPRMVKAVFRHKASLKKKGKRELNSAPNISAKCGEVNRVGTFPCKGKIVFQKRPCCPTPRSTTPVDEIDKKNNDSSGTKLDLTPNNSNGVRAVGEKMSESSRSREKGECSQSSKSSIGDYSSSTSISGESHQSGSSGYRSRPHMSKDVRWIAIRYILIKHGSLGLKNFRLLKKLGCGDIGTVYLAELIGSDCLFALKVMDIEYLMSRKKMLRAQTEREILQMLDHPFLPTLYVHFTTDNLLCLVMEYCPGGDLHVLRQKQPGRSFSEPAARFYVAEVLLALEYLHMLGVVYRDLKPENILVREDGHIMLSDFDLSLRCSVSPTLLTSSVPDTQEPVKKLAGPCAENSCIDPLCLQPSWAQASCFSPRLVSSSAAKNRKLKSDMIDKAKPLPQLVVEPTDARSNSFVGTHEYLAPEIIRGDGHGSAVDWWTFGIFLYELLFGRTPFKGPGNEETLANVVSQSLMFPENPPVSFHARDLIRGLLVKEPENRLGSVRGAAEIKQHQFFEGLNWALIRCAAPPDTLRCYDVATPVAPLKKKEGKCLNFRTNGEDIEFELF